MHRLPLLLFSFVLLMQITSVAYADTVKLAWDPNTDSNLAGYRIYRTEQAGIYSSQPLNGSTLITTPSWTDSTVKKMRLPIAELDSAGFPILFPHTVSGDGWNSEIQLVNPTNSVLSGAISSFSADYPLSPTSEWFYEIAPGSAFSLQVSETGSRPRVEYVRVTPLYGTTSPSGLLILSFHDSGTTISQTGVNAVSDRK